MLITFAAPRPNDPNVYGDWPWTNGGNTIGGSHNNGNSGWGYPHNNGYYGKRDIGKCIHWSIILMVSLSRYVVVDGFSIHNQGVFLPQYNADFLPVPIMWWAASGGFAWDPSRHHPFPPPPLSSSPTWFLLQVGAISTFSKATNFTSPAGSCKNITKSQDSDTLIKHLTC